MKSYKSQLQQKSRRRVFMIIGVLITIFLILVIMRIWAYLVLRSNTNKQTIPIVSVITAARGPSHENIVLPGNVQAWHEAPIYARANGYVKNWFVDIGDKVSEGQLLATIETPELNAQLRQAEADLNVVIANNKLAQSTAIRWLALLKTDSVSKQETDEKVDGARSLAASVIAARANRDRLHDLVSFGSVIAPFAGTISARATDIGALINAGNNPDAKPLFRIVQSNPLRVYVKIPQNYVSRIQSKMTVKLRFAEYPGQQFAAKLLQTADAIDPITRTLLAQFVMNNKQGKILPGGYTEVFFDMPTSYSAIRIPINTMLFRAQGSQVATVDKNNRVALKKVTINRDFGTDVEIEAGINPGEKIILNPPDSIINGEQVQVQPG